MKKVILFVIVSVFVSANAAFSQQEAGDLEIQIAGTYLTSIGTDFDFSQGTIQGKLGRYITDNLEIGVAPTITITTTDAGFGDSDIDVTFGGGAFVQFAFLLGDATTVPYIGGQYFKSDLSESDDSGSAGVTGGLKFFVTEKAAFDFSGNYLFDLNEGSEGGLLLFVAGISFLF